MTKVQEEIHARGGKWGSAQADLPRRNEGYSQRCQEDVTRHQQRGMVPRIRRQKAERILRAVPRDRISRVA